MHFSDYQTGGYYDEMFEPNGSPRPHARLLIEIIQSLSNGQLLRYKHAADRHLLQMGITFNVYGEAEGTERIFPFDLVPRIVPAGEWEYLERGLHQRIHALNEFIDDIYHEQKILKDGIIPREVILSASSYRPQCQGLNPPRRVWCHITGTDLVRDRDGQYYVLEDNLRVPSGVSYVLENREVLKRILPQVFEGLAVRPVDEYPSRLLEMLESIAPVGREGPRVVVLTPGLYNSAYFEHSFLAQQMGVQLVEGRDLVVTATGVFMRTTKGLERVDVIYRRIDDDFLDPKAFRKDSLLGVPGLMAAYQAGRVALANAPGNGVADDKVIYSYVPDMIRYYEGAEPILPNVPTFLCWRDTDRQHVLANLEKLVVKSANEAGGYGMLVGPHSTREQQQEFAAKIEAQSTQLHRAADSGVIAGAHHRRRSLRGPARRPAALRALRERNLRAAGRTDARGLAQGFAGGELVPGRRQQGYLGAHGSNHGNNRAAGPETIPDPRISNLFSNDGAAVLNVSNPLLSRVAESVYWMARYIERAENVARFIGVNLHLMLDLPASDVNQWRAIVDTTGDAKVFSERYGEATTENVVEFLTADPKNPNSIFSCVRAARENARSVRETISSEMWEQVNGLYLLILGSKGRLSPDALPLFFHEVRMAGSQFQGVTDSTMSHNEPWQFIGLGRTLERADQTTPASGCEVFHPAALGERRRYALRRHSMGRGTQIRQRVRDVPQTARTHFPAPAGGVSAPGQRISPRGSILDKPCRPGAARHHWSPSGYVLLRLRTGPGAAQVRTRLCARRCYPCWWHARIPRRPAGENE